MAERNDHNAESAMLPQTGASTSKLNSSVPPKRAGHEKHAELFRKDLISAMKLPDTEVLQYDEYLLIADTWKLEWERGVQVPVDPDAIPPLVVRRVSQPDVAENHADSDNAFTLPKKLLYSSADDNFKPAVHELYDLAHRTENVCRYDLDELDTTWLTEYNRLRQQTGEGEVSESAMELMLETFEMQCHANLQQAIRTVDGLGIEYDENVVCDICRSPDGEDSNEMVFCDACDICVHQACYGIQNIPEGNWLCRTCALNIRPRCLLCPKTGGAMKSTKSGTKWAHISCALWIPEVTIDCPDKMEPITNISQIPASRWALLCSLCRERVGACIQCSVKACKTSFHVTCAFQYGLDLKTTFDDDGADVQLKAFCLKHSSKKDDRRTLPSDIDIDESMTDEERTEMRSHRLKKLNEEFYEHVDTAEVAEILDVDLDTVDYMYSYWVFKRKVGFDMPLLMPKTEEVEMLTKQREDTLIARMKMFVHLRQDLERVRNLVYMVNKREKTRSLVYQMKEDIFHQEVALAELEVGELSSEQVSETKVIPLPKYCHHSTGTVYDHPEDILRTARLFEERGQILDRRNLSVSLQKTSTPVFSKSYLAVDVSPTRSRRNRQNMRSNQADVDGLASSPAASRSPIQQLFRDKMEGLESGSWAAASLEVKIDSNDGSPSETDHETSVTPAVSSEQLNAVTVPSLFLSTVTSTSNGLVKALQAVDNHKLTNSKPDGHSNQKDKSAGNEQMPVSDVIQISENAIEPSVTAATDSRVKPEFQNVINGDLDSGVLNVVTADADKVRASEQSDHKKVETTDTENVETLKTKATKLARRPAPKKSLEPAKAGSEKECRSAKIDADTVPRTRTRRRVSKDQSCTEKVKDMHKSVGNEEMPVADTVRENESAVIPTAEDPDLPVSADLNVSQSQRTRLSRSARKKRGGEQLDDSSDVLTRRHAAGTKSVRRKSAGSSSMGSPDTEKPREQDHVCIQGASESIIDSVLQQESLADAQRDESSDSSRQKLPLQDSSVLNCDTVRESVTQQITKSSSEATDRTSLNTPVPSNSENLHSPCFHEDNFRLDFSENNSDENQHMTVLQSVTSDTADSNEFVTQEAKHRGDGAAVNDTPLVKANNTSQLKCVNSPNYQETGNLLDNDRDAFLPKTPAMKSANVKKRSLSLSRSRTKARPSVCEVETAVERHDDDAETAKEDDVRRKSVKQRRRRTSRVDVDVESASESLVMNQTDDNVSRHKDVSTVDNKEDSTSQISANKDVTDIPVSISLEYPQFTETADTQLELTGSLLAHDVHIGDSVSPSADEGSKLVTSSITGVDNLQTSLQSAVSDAYNSPRSLAPNLVKFDVNMSNLHSGKTGFWNHHSTMSAIAAEDFGKCGVTDVGSQLSELSKTSSASSRKRAAHLMAGCRHRTVGVKKPSLTTSETTSGQTVEVDAADKPPISERLSYVPADFNNHKSVSDKCNHPSPARRRPFFQTCRLEESLSSSSDRFFRTSPVAAADISSDYTSSLKFSATEDIGSGEMLKSKCVPERPLLMKHNSAGSEFSRPLLGSRELSKTSSTSPQVVADSQRESLRADLLRKFRPFQLTVSESIRRRVQDGLQLLSSIRTAPTICSHTRQKLVDYLNQSRQRRNNEPAAHVERLPLRPIDDKRDQTDSGSLLRRRLPARPHRRVYSELEYVSGDELTSPMISDRDSNSDSDYSVDLEDLASVKSSNSVVRTRDRRLSTVQH